MKAAKTSIRECSVRLWRCDGDGRKSAARDHSSDPATFHERGSPAAVDATDQVQRGREASMLAIKVEADGEGAVVKTESCIEHNQLWPACTAEPDLNFAEMCGSFLEMTDEIDKTTIKEELDIGPTVLQSKAVPPVDVVNAEGYDVPLAVKMEPNVEGAITTEELEAGHAHLWEDSVTSSSPFINTIFPLQKKGTKRSRGSRGVTNVPKVRKVAKTGAQRIREYRARIRALENAAAARSASAVEGMAAQTASQQNLANHQADICENQHSLLYKALNRQRSVDEQEARIMNNSLFKLTYISNIYLCFLQGLHQLVPCKCTLALKKLQC